MEIGGLSWRSRQILEEASSSYVHLLAWVAPAISTYLHLEGEVGTDKARATKWGAGEVWEEERGGSGLTARQFSAVGRVRKGGLKESKMPPKVY